MIKNNQKLNQIKHLDQKKKEFILVAFYKLSNNLVVLMLY